MRLGTKSRRVGPAAVRPRRPTRFAYGRRICSCFVGLFLLLCPHSFAQDAESPAALDIHRLRKQLSSDDWILQCEALQRLGHWQIEDATPAITNILENSKTPWLRGRALVALARIRGRAMLPVAGRMLKENDAALRKAGVEALEILGSGQAAAAARNLLDDPDPEIRAMAAAICASRYPEQAWPTVRAMASQPNPALSVYLSRALAAIGTEEALVEVEKLYDAAAGNEDLRYQIMRGLQAADAAAIPLWVRLMADYNPGHRAFQLGRNVLASHDKKKVAAALQVAFASDKTRLYATAAMLAADVCPSEELEDAIAASWLKCEGLPPGTVRAGLAALTKLDPSRHTALFRHYLNNKDGATRALAVRCRGLCDKHDLFREFRSHVDDADHRVVLAALESVSRVPEDVRPAEGVVDYLAGPLQSRNRVILLAAIELLGNRGVPADFRKALQTLGPNLESGNHELRAAAADALVKLGGIEKTPDIVAAQGFISHWKVIGTFLNDSKNTGFETVYPPEKEIDFSKTYESQYRWDFEGGAADQLQKLQVKWLDVQVPKVDGTLNVAIAMPVPTRYAVAYAVADIHSDKEQTVRAVVEQEGSVRLWVNGQLAKSEPQAIPTGASIPLESLYGSKVLVFVDRQILGPYDKNRNRILEPAEVATVRWVEAWKQDDTNRDGHLTREELARRTARRFQEHGSFNISLKEGQNRILVKTANQGGRWWLRVRLLDEKENRKASGVTQAPMKHADAGGGLQSLGATR